MGLRFYSFALLVLCRGLLFSPVRGAATSLPQPAVASAANCGVQSLWYSVLAIISCLLTTTTIGKTVSQDRIDWQADGNYICDELFIPPAPILGARNNAVAIAQCSGESGLAPEVATSDLVRCTIAYSYYTADHKVVQTIQVNFVWQINGTGAFDVQCSSSLGPSSCATKAQKGQSVPNWGGQTITVGM